MHAPTYQSPSRGDKSFHLPAPNSEPVTEFVLSAGDGLYLPFGYWHNVETVSDISMHVTIGLDFARRLDILMLISDELTSDSFFREKIDYSMIEAEALDLKERLVESIRRLDMEVFLARLRAQHLDGGACFDFPTFLGANNA